MILNMTCKCLWLLNLLNLLLGVTKSSHVAVDIIVIARIQPSSCQQMNHSLMYLEYRDF